MNTPALHVVAQVPQSCQVNNLGSACVQQIPGNQKTVQRRQWKADNADYAHTWEVTKNHPRGYLFFFPPGVTSEV